ncbi:hypothetical protein niasHT_023852 [Heterodera trifolii]|uniref:UDP-glucuronosyltransferase n=1 Tax=Heterodera trifolii TaxID=157864 RepID=A0ABD2JCI3_9BILA
MANLCSAKLLKVFVLLFLLLLLNSLLVLPARILVALAPDNKSHLRSMLPLINRLASSDHSVHIFSFSSEKIEEKFAPNVALITVPTELNRENIMKEMGERIWKQTMHSPMMAFVYKIFAQSFEVLLQKHSDKVAEVLNSPWDLLVIGELFSVHAYAFALFLSDHRRVPYAVFSPAMMMHSNAFKNALGHSWVTHPHPFSPILRHSDDRFQPQLFSSRLFNVLESLGEMLIWPFVDAFVIAPKIALLTGRNDFSFDQLYHRSEIALVDSIDLLAFPQPSANDVLSAGAHCEMPAELPKDYRVFVEDPHSKGTVYVAFGTAVPWDYAPPHIANAFFDAFERLSDHRFIFSFRGTFPNRTLSPHIRLVSWAPQLEVLSHPKTKVFLTHSGLKSIKESLCSGTPMLTMPMFAEQAHNAKMLLEFGIGVGLSKFSIDAQTVFDGLSELLHKPKYAQRALKLRHIFLDRPMNALDEANFRLSQIIRRSDGSKGKGEKRREFVGRKGTEKGAMESFHLDWTFILLAVITFLFLDK